VLKTILICKFILFFSLCNISASEKWIVVTTIQYPTNAMKHLSNYASTNGWKLLVIGDKKTPKDWYLDNAIFLSADDQENLNYELLKFLPWNHYCRKNIGYLYAIENGAKIIYETDDDNFLVSELKPLPNSTSINCVQGLDHVINIYACFGQDSVWPRGFPLDKISVGNKLYMSTKEKCLIGVEQGLVNKEPDVDAIFRLTQKREVYFENHPPCVLEKKYFCPFNTQNTLFHYTAFWGLYIPATTSFRSCDIWRGYVTQCLLWEIDHYLCFISPTAIQERNPHDFFHDFCDEMELYLKAGALVQDLLVWTANSKKFKDKIIELHVYLSDLGYFKNLETSLVKAWLNDLQKIGYKFPEHDQYF
jgi:STELLO glycosyltransferases